MFIIFLRVIYLKTFIRIFYTVIVLYLSEIYLFIYLFIYLVYRKEQIKIRGKSREKIGREYDQIDQIIKKKCYI